MAGPEDIIASIDGAAETQANAERTTAALMSEAGKFVLSIATNELSYELASSAGLESEESVDLEEIADAIATDRHTLSHYIEVAIANAKKALRAEYEQRLLREELTADIDPNES